MSESDVLPHATPSPMCSFRPTRTGRAAAADPSVKAIVRMVFGYQRACRISRPQTSAFADAAGVFHLSADFFLPSPRLRPLEKQVHPVKALNLKYNINSREKWLTKRRECRNNRSLCDLTGRRCTQRMCEECGGGRRGSGSRIHWTPSAVVLPIPSAGFIFHAKAIFERVFSYSLCRTIPVSCVCVCELREMFFFHMGNYWDQFLIRTACVTGRSGGRERLEAGSSRKQQSSMMSSKTGSAVKVHPENKVSSCSQRALLVKKSIKNSN